VHLCPLQYATKGHAIQKLISFYDISLEEVAVFGDDTPDMGMFGLFGHSIAMGNAHASLKAVASYVTLSNDEDGLSTR
jgi:5-amino-6-(5-phospho-D-ribitylamino)uracil phosphatase